MALCSHISVTGNLFCRISALLHHHYSRLPSVWVLIEINVRICGSNRVRQSKLSRKSDLHTDVGKPFPPSLTQMTGVECETLSYRSHPTFHQQMEFRLFQTPRQIPGFHPGRPGFTSGVGMSLLWVDWSGSHWVSGSSPRPGPWK